MKELHLADELAVQYDPYQALANAIITEAAEDYRMYKRKIIQCRDKLENTPPNQNKLRIRLENQIERYIDKLYELTDFFYSDWFTVLSNLDGELLVEALEGRKYE